MQAPISKFFLAAILVVVVIISNGIASIFVGV